MVYAGKGGSPGHKKVDWLKADAKHKGFVYRTYHLVVMILLLLLLLWSTEEFHVPTLHHTFGLGTIFESCQSGKVTNKGS